MPRPRPSARLATSGSRRTVWAVVAGAISLPAWAQTDTPASTGPWIFATAALVLVAWLAWRAGRREAPVAQKADKPDPPADGAAARTVDALLAAHDGQTRVCRRAPNGRDWQLLAAHPKLPAGASALDSVPAAVAFAARSLNPGTSAEAEGWHLQSTGAGADERLVLRQLPPAPPAGEDPANFSFTVSHDLRAPVRVVEGFTRILKEDYGRQIDRIGNDHLDRVLAAAARMNAMIDAMLSLARISSQPIARQPVNLSQMASFVIDDLRRANPERLVDTAVAPDLQALGDPTLLRQVVENLIGNAWKYTSRCERAVIAFGAQPRDGRLVYEVRDNGAGFDMRSAERLFGLFQRLHSANDFPGTGVGLASVQRIVRRHGGEIWAEAEPGRGACFYFTLPG
jgi:signal transduction histidine kinase